MGLFRCRCLACCSVRSGPRRRRISILGTILALIVTVAIASWLMILVLEDTARVESVRRQVQVIYAEYHSPFGANRPRNLTTTQKIVDSVKPPGQHQLLSNSRLPKEITDSNLNYDGRSPSENESEGDRDHQKQGQQLPGGGVVGNKVNTPVSQTKESVVLAGDNNSSKSDKRTTLSAPAESDAKANVATPSMNGPNSLELLRREYLRYNTEQLVLNAEKFPPLAPDGLVLVVQVHRRDGYLKQLLNSLRNAEGIGEVLLVLSHDYFYDEMNQLVRSIDFCRVIQIYFPFSLQLFPDTFPGQSKGDCPRDVTKEQALSTNCTNALHPDSYGHYREAAVTVVKHHWWWKVNTVFDNLKETRHFNGSVLFLEEDHYVSPDFIAVARKLAALRDEKCPNCDFINLGMYAKLKSFGGLGDRVTVGVWNAGKNNMGFGMSRTSWNTIRGCREKFCTYDDYNWDWSLNSLSKRCVQRDLKVMVVKAPRIFHIGTCGMHHKKRCNEAADANVAQALIDNQKDHLFPESLRLDPGVNPAPARKSIVPYGGWGDVRDHELCRTFSS